MIKQSYQKENKIPSFDELPKHLKQKYKNSIIFQKESRVERKKLKIDVQKLKQRKIDKEKTIQEKLQQFQLNATQEKRLREVFRELSNQKESFGKQQLSDILRKMKAELLSSDLDLMIWEFDEDLDGRISLREFQRMYKICMMDKFAAEPKKLFHLTQYLMYCKNDCYEITPENTYELEYIRAYDIAKLELLNSKNKSKQATDQSNAFNFYLANEEKLKEIFEQSIKTIFGNNYENDKETGIEKTITFQAYLQKRTKNAIQHRREAIEMAKVAKFKSNLKNSKLL